MTLKSKLANTSSHSLIHWCQLHYPLLMALDSISVAVCMELPQVDTSYAHEYLPTKHLSLATKEREGVRFKGVLMDRICHKWHSMNPLFAPNSFFLTALHTHRHICMCAHMHNTHLHCTHTDTCMASYVHIHICIHHANMHTCTCAHNASAHTHCCNYMYAHAWVHTHMHRYTVHTHILFF